MFFGVTMEEGSKSEISLFFRKMPGGIGTEKDNPRLLTQFPVF